MAKSTRSATSVGDNAILSIVDGHDAAGTIRLAPLHESLTSDVIVVEIGLSGADAGLRFGDLRCAALELERRAEYEAAHRLWTVLGTEAFRLGDLVLAAAADERAEVALSLAIIASRPLGPTAKYDYEALATDRDDGLSIADTAKRWSCSPTTVKRAVKYVEVRDAALEANPRLVADIDRGDDVSDLAERYEIEKKVMRWIVISHFDRRSKERDE